MDLTIFAIFHGSYHYLVSSPREKQNPPPETKQFVEIEVSANRRIVKPHVFIGSKWCQGSAEFA